MANSEACELYIEQEIKTALNKGKTPYSIGKDLSKWIERLFETHVKPRTIEQKARRSIQKNATNVTKKTESSSAARPAPFLVKPQTTTKKIEVIEDDLWIGMEKLYFEKIKGLHNLIGEMGHHQAWPEHQQDMLTEVKLLATYINQL